MTAPRHLPARSLAAAQHVPRMRRPFAGTRGLARSVRPPRCTQSSAAAHARRRGLAVGAATGHTLLRAATPLPPLRRDRELVGALLQAVLPHVHRMRYDDEYFARCSYMSMYPSHTHNTSHIRSSPLPLPPHKVIRALSHIHARVVPVVSSLRARAMLAPTHSLSHLDDCENIFIDVGANSGDSMAKWYSQISCYENCMERRNFKHLWQDPCLPANETCGKDASCEAVKNTCFCQSQLQKGCGWEWPYWFPRAVRRSYCGIAFEPNPTLSDKLHHRARELKRSGAAPKIKVFNGTALSVRDVLRAVRCGRQVDHWLIPCARQAQNGRPRKSGPGWIRQRDASECAHPRRGLLRAKPESQAHLDKA